MCMYARRVDLLYVRSGLTTWELTYQVGATPAKCRIEHLETTSRAGLTWFPCADAQMYREAGLQPRLPRVRTLVVVLPPLPVAAAK